MWSKIRLFIYAYMSFNSFVGFKQVVNGDEIEPSRMAVAFILLAIACGSYALGEWQEIQRNKKEESE